MNSEPSIQDVLEAIQTFAEDTDRRFDRIESEMGFMKSDIGSMKSDIGSMKSDIGSMKSDIGSMKSDISDLKTRVTHIESAMITKNYLDDKLADLRGDLILLARKQNKKFEVLVEELVISGQLKQTVADRLLAMEPFASR